MPNIELAASPAGTKNGLNYLLNNEVILLFFAPQKKFVHLLGEFNNWQQKPEYLVKKDPDSNLFWIKLDGLEVGKEYTYQFLVDGSLAIADQYAKKKLDPNNNKYIPNSAYPNLKAYSNGAKGIVSVLQTRQKLFDWKATNFNRPKQENLLIYELLIRDFTTEVTYNSALQKLS